MELYGSEKGNETLDKIAKAIKGTLNNSNELRMTEAMKKHLQTLRLIDDKGEWASANLSKISDRILPVGINMDKINQFIDRIVLSSKRNPYFMNFMDSLSEDQSTIIRERFKNEGKSVLPDVIAYAIILENLTKESAEDYHILEEISSILTKQRRVSSSFKELPLFHKIKLLSVIFPIKSYLRYHKERGVPPKSGGIAVAINIREATWTDFLKNYGRNAYVGRVLANNRCGLKQLDKRTGAGPSGFSEDGKAIERVYPFPEDWAGLYQVWNMAFVAGFQDFPYVMVKLFIPQVSNYFDKPKNYIYNRAIALFFYLNFASFDYVNKKKRGEKIIQWRDKSFKLAFGRANASMAKKYQQRVKKSKKVK